MTDYIPDASEPHVRIADFTRYPGGRFRTDGPGSGEAFRDEHLVPALRRALADNAKLMVFLDGVAGLPPGFLEEAFGGLARLGFKPEQTAQLAFMGTLRNVDYAPRIRQYIKDAHQAPSFA